MSGMKTRIPVRTLLMLGRFVIHHRRNVHCTTSFSTLRRHKFVMLLFALRIFHLRVVKSVMLIICCITSRVDVVKGELVSFDWEAQDNSKAKVLLFSDMTLNVRFFFQKCQTETFLDKYFWHLVTMFEFVFFRFLISEEIAHQSQAVGRFSNWGFKGQIGWILDF